MSIPNSEVSAFLPGELACDICGRLFTKASAMKGHWMKMHKKLKPVESPLPISEQELKQVSQQPPFVPLITTSLRVLRSADIPLQAATESEPPTCKLRLLPMPLSRANRHGLRLHRKPTVVLETPAVLQPGTTRKIRVSQKPNKVAPLSLVEFDPLLAKLSRYLDSRLNLIDKIATQCPTSEIEDVVQNVSLIDTIRPFT